MRVALRVSTKGCHAYPRGRRRRPLASFLKKGLEAEHYAVEIAPDGEEARYASRENDYDLLILDLNLPKIDGITVLRGIRPQKPSNPRAGAYGTQPH